MVKKCPFCGSSDGYYQLEMVHRFLYYTYDNKPYNASEDICDYSGTRRYCIECDKILPKKMFDES